MSWMDQTLDEQLSTARDFPLGTPVSKRYAILCTHRSGSNLLTESLYHTGVAGDPLELFNLRMLKKLYAARGVDRIPYADYLAEMQARRTSPNGVFGFNVKPDQFDLYFRDNLQEGIALLKGCDYVLLHLRQSKLKQAVSTYIGQQRDTFRIPASVTDDDVARLTQDIPFDPAAIAKALSMIYTHEGYWLGLLKEHNIPFGVMSYEYLVDNYASAIGTVLEKLGVPESERIIPEMPTKKIANEKNHDLEQAFLNSLLGRKLQQRKTPS